MDSWACKRWGFCCHDRDMIRNGAKTEPNPDERPRFSQANPAFIADSA